MKLRDYQQAAVEQIAAAFERGQYSGIVHFATGLGKTETAFGVFQQLVDPRRERAVFVAPSRALIYQTAARARRALTHIQNGVFYCGRTRPGVGVVMGSHNEPSASFVVGSVQTLIDRTEGTAADRRPIEARDVVVYERDGEHAAVRLSSASDRSVLISRRMDEVLQYGVPSLLMFDEAHHAVADNAYILIKRLQQLRAALGLKPLKLVGFTATPVRADGRGLVNLFERIYARADFRWGQRRGFLVPFADPIRVTVETPQGRISPLRTANWEHEVYTAYERLAKDRWCIGFVGAVGGLGGVEVSRRLTTYFQSRGTPAAHTDGEMCILPDGTEAPPDQRGVIYDGFMRGDVRVLFSYGVGLEGLDLPRADCLLWMRPTDNAVLRTQAVGRILRPHPDKKDALIVDFTDRALELEPIGTLLGYKIDPENERYVKDDEGDEEADLLLDGVDAAPLRASNRAVAISQQYEKTVILVRQSNDWYDSGDFLTLAVSPEDGLVVVAPHYTLGEVARVCAGDIARFQAGDPNPYSQQTNAVYHRFYERLKDYGNLQSLAEFMTWADEFLNNYTLWHVAVDGFKSSLRERGFVESASTLEDILANASVYIDTSMNPTKAFVKRSQRWKREKCATPAQLQTLRSLGLKADPSLSCGEASQMISNEVLLRPIRPIVERVERKIRELVLDAV